MRIRTLLLFGYGITGAYDWNGFCKVIGMEINLISDLIYLFLFAIISDSPPNPALIGPWALCGGDPIADWRFSPIGTE